MAAVQIRRSSNPVIECMVAQNPIFSDPDGGGTAPKIFKPRDRVHGGTESHIFISGWWRYRPSDPQTQGYSAWWHRIPYCQIRMVAAQILKPRDRVDGGTKSHIVRSGWWRHRSSNPGIECMVAQNPILSDPDGGGTDPETQGCSAWWHRIPYCQIRKAAAQIL
jgi:hypothetical protein